MSDDRLMKGIISSPHKRAAMTRFTGCVAALAVGLIVVNAIGAQTPNACEVQPDSSRLQQDSRLAQQIQSRQNPLQDLAYLTDVIGPRVTGSRQLIRAHDWVEQTLSANGASNVRRESYIFGPTFNRGKPKARLVSHSGIDLAIAQLGWSPETRGAVRGEVLVQRGTSASALASDIGRFGGKFILASQGPLPAKNSSDSATLRRVAESIKKEGALAYLRESDKPLGLSMGGSPNWVNPMRPVVPTGILSKEGYALIKRLSERGESVILEVDLPGRTSSNAVRAFNSMGELTGTSNPDEIVIIAAHLDSWDLGTGATDNGVGVAAVIEALRAIKQIGISPRRTIRGVLFSGEEQGDLGSKAYIKDHLAELDRIQAVLVIDNGAGRIKGWALQHDLDDQKNLVSSAIKPVQNFGVKDLLTVRWTNSDWQPFADNGVPTLGAVQDEGDYALTWHSEFDTLSHVKPEDFVQMSTALAVTAWELANMCDRLPHASRLSKTP